MYLVDSLLQCCFLAAAAGDAHNLPMAYHTHRARTQYKRLLSPCLQSSPAICRDTQISYLITALHELAAVLGARRSGSNERERHNRRYDGCDTAPS